MADRISGEEYPLWKIFSSDFEFNIPSYQRPYAWTKEETSILFNDLYDFYENEKDDDYFLGSIVLIKEKNNPKCDVIDGQQRLTTLSILFSVMASLTTGDAHDDFMSLLQEKGKVIVGILPKPRVKLRSRDQSFFNKYIQESKISDLLSLDPKQLETEAQKHIFENCKVLVDLFEETFNGNQNELIKFSQFLTTNCYLVAVSTASAKSAFRIFSVMNSRGLDLLAIDIIKSEVIGEIPDSQKNTYTDKWEEMENTLGREGFNELFAHIRTIFVKEKAKTNLLEEFRTYVVAKHSPTVLIDSVIEPFAKAYFVLKNEEYKSTQNADAINNILYWLNKIDNYDWMPPAISFLSAHMNDSEYVLSFIRKLERLASYLHVTGQDVNKRIERYKWVLTEMESNPNHSLEYPLKNIELTAMEKKRFLDSLNSEIYLMPARRRNFIIQRLDSFVSNNAAKYDAKVFSIEHVLPQHPTEGSEWLRLWPNESERIYWLNRIANLVPLSRIHNSSAQNYDFDKKKNTYFTGKNGTSAYALTTQVLNTDEWTPEIVKDRQDNLIKVFTDKWDLNITPEEIQALADQKFHLAIRGGDATGIPGDNGQFIVLKGSIVSPDIVPSMNNSSYLNLRKELFNSGVIVNNTFVCDYAFESVSAAAAVIAGRTANGRKEWATLDGRSYGKAISSELGS